MQLSVELRPHIGQMNTPVGIVEIEHDQWIALGALNDAPLRQIGYLPKRDGAKLLWLPHVREKLPTPIVEQFEQAILAKREELAQA